MFQNDVPHAHVGLHPQGALPGDVVLGNDPVPFKEKENRRTTKGKKAQIWNRVRELWGETSSRNIEI
jgi:hypothetical protein